MQQPRPTELSDSESHSSEGLDNVVEAVQSKRDKFSVRWRCFQNDDWVAGDRAMEIISQLDVEAWYVGSCADPYECFFQEPSPHSVRFHCLYPVWVGKRARAVEMEVYSRCIEIETDVAKCVSEPSASWGGDGSRHISTLRNIRFVYVCVRWTTESLQVLYS